MPQKQRIVLISTGLGRVYRGFEQYVHSLANYLSQIPSFPFQVVVYATKKPTGASYNARKIPSLHRNGWTLRLHPNPSKRLRLERFTFWLCAIPALFIDRPNAIYLGEYPIYGWLSKIRKWGIFKSRLALYTGGQAIPGKSVFNPSLDFVHHITNVYLDACGHIPSDRQLLLPHFLVADFNYDSHLIADIRNRSGQKKVILSVGAIEKSSKRMDLLLQALAPLKGEVFPVLLGEPTADSPEIIQLAEDRFGAGNYIISKVPHSQLGSWYQAADGFVLCSPKESFGLALIEALYHGLPVACYRFAETEFVLQQQAHWLKCTQPQQLGTELAEWIAQWTTGQVCSVTAHRFIQQHYSFASLREAYFNMFLKIVESHDTQTKD